MRLGSLGNVLGELILVEMKNKRKGQSKYTFYKNLSWNHEKDQLSMKRGKFLEKSKDTSYMAFVLMQMRNQYNVILG